MAAIGRGGAIVIENRRDSAESLRPRNRAAGASIAFAAILSCVIVLAGLLAVYPSIDAAIRFMLYVLVFNFLPGMVVAHLVLPRLEELGWTRHRLAEVLGVPDGTVSRYISEEREPVLKVAVKIADALGLDVRDLVSDANRTGTDG